MLHILAEQPRQEVTINPERLGLGRHGLARSLFDFSESSA